MTSTRIYNILLLFALLLTGCTTTETTESKTYRTYWYTSGAVHTDYRKVSETKYEIIALGRSGTEDRDVRNAWKARARELADGRKYTISLNESTENKSWITSSLRNHEYAKNDIFSIFGSIEVELVQQGGADNSGQLR